MSAEVHINEMVTTQLEHWQDFVLPCETDHETPGENPVPSRPPEELLAPAQRGAMLLAVNNPFQVLTRHVSAKNRPCSV